MDMWTTSLALGGSITLPATQQGVVMGIVVGGSNIIGNQAARRSPTPAPSGYGQTSAGYGYSDGNGDDGPSPFVYLCLLGPLIVVAMVIFCCCRGDMEGNNQRNIEEGVPPVETDEERRVVLQKRLDKVRSQMDEKDMP